MPQLLIKGVSVEQVKIISKPLVQELADLCACGTDNFTLDVMNSTSVFDGEEVPGYPFIEVKWFERGLDIQNEFASIITKQVLSLGIPEVEVAFITYKEANYYVNGTSFEEDK